MPCRTNHDRSPDNPFGLSIHSEAPCLTAIRASGKKGADGERLSSWATHAQKHSTLQPLAPKREMCQHGLCRCEINDALLTFLPYQCSNSFLPFVSQPLFLRQELPRRRLRAAMLPSMAWGMATTADELLTAPCSTPMASPLPTHRCPLAPRFASPTRPMEKALW